MSRTNISRSLDMLHRLIPVVLCIALMGISVGGHAQQSPLRVAVVGNSPPMSYLDADGKISGFNVSLAEALCAEMKVKCTLILTKLDFLLDDLSAGKYDFAALGFLVTPERQKKVLFTEPIYRSTTVWMAKPGILPGDKNVRVSTFRGSVHEKYAKANGWDYVSSHNYTDFIEQFSAGITNAMIVPLLTSIGLQNNPRFLELGLVPTPLRVPELEGDACYAVNPKQAELKDRLDKALVAIRDQGVYSRINTKFLPLRVN